MKKTFILFILTIFAAHTFAQVAVERIDPPNWWTGMKNKSLQLMVHGNGIGKTKATINFDGVKVKEVKSSGDNYLYIDLLIGKKAKPGSFTIEFRQDNQVAASYNYELKSRQAGSADRKGFGTSDLFYLIMPDRFANGDPSNDDMPGMLEKADRNNPNGRHGGDIAGITSHLDYLSNLGVTTIWCTPLLENNMPAYSYHGYAITDFYKTDPRFGTNQGFRQMVDEAHSKGMKVVMDMVFNHFGTGSYLMKDLPQKDWVNQWPQFTRSNYRAGVITDPYHSATDLEKMEKGWFDVTMADYNQRNPYVAKYLIQNSIWWIEYAGLDGIRQDTYPYPDKDFMADWMKAVRLEYPNFNTVGECWLNTPAQVSYWQDKALNRDGYRSYLTHVFDFPLMFAIQQALNEDEGWSSGLTKLYELLSMDFVYANPGNIITFADNHDIERVYEVQKSVDNVKMAMAFIATTRGTPLIYYGTEALSDRGNLEGDPGKRKDFPGGWQGDGVNYFTGQNLSNGQRELYDYMVKLFSWRKTNKCVQDGKLTHYIPENSLYVYFRTLGKESVMMVMNNSKIEKTLETGRYSENLSAFRRGKDVITGTQFKNLDKIDVPAKSVRIIELSK